MKPRLVRAVRNVAVLTAIWVLLWGRLSAANVLSGIVVSLMLLAVFPSPSSSSLSRPRPLAIARLLVHLTGQLVASNITVSREVLTRRSRVRTGIVACRLRTESEATVAFLANVLSLSPGTMPVHVQTDPPEIFVHVLHLAKPADVRQRVARLETLTVRAFGSVTDMERLGRPLRRDGADVPATGGGVEDKR